MGLSIDEIFAIRSTKRPIMGSSKFEEEKSMQMRSMGKFVLAAMLSLAAWVGQAGVIGEEGDTTMLYWMVKDQSLSSMQSAVAEKGGDGTMSFNWAKLVAVADGVKTPANWGLLETSGDVVSTAPGPQLDGALAADLGQVSGAITSFWVEYYNYNEQNGALTLLGWSESVTPSSLISQGSIAQFTDDHLPSSQYSPWSPTEFTAVPEPTSGTLLLIGGALLALRRKQKKGAC